LWRPSKGTSNIDTTTHFLVRHHRFTVDHPGIPNTQLVKENSALARAYSNKSVAEQNRYARRIFHLRHPIKRSTDFYQFSTYIFHRSIDIAWALLNEESFSDLRRAIAGTEAEMKRFRQLVVNAVMATDILDKDLKALRNDRW